MRQCAPRTTICITTLDRPAFVERTLKYYADAGFAGTILIGDGSTGPAAQAGRDIVRRYGTHLRLRWIGTSHLSQPATMSLLADRVASDYAVYSGDDDYLVPEAMAECERFLDDHPDFVAAHGTAIALNADGVHGVPVSLDPYWLPVLSYHEAPLERFEFFLKQYSVAIFAVHRRSAWREMFRETRHMSDKAFGSEIAPCVVSAILGKCAEIPGLYLVRQIHPSRYHLPRQSDWVLDPDFAQSCRLLLAQVRRLLAERHPSVKSVTIKCRSWAAVMGYLFGDLYGGAPDRLADERAAQRWQRFYQSPPLEQSSLLEHTESSALRYQAVFDSVAGERLRASKRPKMLLSWGNPYVLDEAITPVLPDLAKRFAIVLLLVDYRLSKAIREQAMNWKTQGLLEDVLVAPSHGGSFDAHLYIRQLVPALKRIDFDVFLSISAMQPYERYIDECALPEKCRRILFWPHPTNLFLYPELGHAVAENADPHEIDRVIARLRRKIEPSLVKELLRPAPELIGIWGFFVTAMLRQRPPALRKAPAPRAAAMSKQVSAPVAAEMVTTRPLSPPATGATQPDARPPESGDQGSAVLLPSAPVADARAVLLAAPRAIPAASTVSRPMTPEPAASSFQGLGGLRHRVLQRFPWVRPIGKLLLGSVPGIVFWADDRLHASYYAYKRFVQWTKRARFLPHQYAGRYGAWFRPWRTLRRLNVQHAYKRFVQLPAASTVSRPMTPEPAASSFQGLGGLRHRVLQRFPWVRPIGKLLLGSVPGIVFWADDRLQANYYAYKRFVQWTKRARFLPHQYAGRYGAWFRPWRTLRRLNVQRAEQYFYYVLDRLVYPEVLASRRFPFRKLDWITQIGTDQFDACLFFNEQDTALHKVLFRNPNMYTVRYVPRRTSEQVQTLDAVLLPFSIHTRAHLTSALLEVYRRDLSIVLKESGVTQVHIRPHPGATDNWLGFLVEELRARNIPCVLVTAERPLSEEAARYRGVFGAVSGSLRDARLACPNIFVVGSVGLSLTTFKDPKRVVGFPGSIGWIEADGRYDARIFQPVAESMQRYPNAAERVIALYEGKWERVPDRLKAYGTATATAPEPELT